MPRNPDTRPTKPHKDFPLFPHLSGRWAKKVKGKLHYFGPWRDPQGALERWFSQKDDLLAGRKPRPDREGLSVRDLANRFLTSKRLMLDSGELTPATFADYYTSCERIVKNLRPNRFVEDLDPEDFEQLRASMAKNWELVTLGNEIQRIRVVIKYAFDAGLIDKPIRYGPTFKRPSKKILRLARAAKGPRMYEADQLRKIIDAASIPLKAMILLGGNCGFGNADVAALPLTALDLESGWVTFPRPKTLPALARNRNCNSPNPGKAAEGLCRVHTSIGSA